MPVQVLIRLDFASCVLSMRVFGNNFRIHVYTNAVNRGFHPGNPSTSIVSSGDLLPRLISG